MNLDTGKPVQIKILADKTGPEPAPGTPWPCRGVEFLGGPPKVWAVSTNWVRDNRAAPWLTVEGGEHVVRPSRPDPAEDESGSAIIALGHLVPDPNLQMPHTFLHIDALVLQTPDGSLRYEVIRQPDKYVAGDKSGTKKVTPKVYAEGKTEVEHFYTVRLVNSQEG